MKRSIRGNVRKYITADKNDRFNRVFQRCVLCSLIEKKKSISSGFSYNVSRSSKYISRVREEITGRESGRAAETKFKPIESEELIKDIDFPQVLGVWSTSYIPKGTRFGPLVGHVYTKDSVPADANRKYFWRVRIVRAPPFKKKKKKKIPR